MYTSIHISLTAFLRTLASTILHNIRTQNLFPRDIVVQNYMILYDFGLHALFCVRSINTMLLLFPKKIVSVQRIGKRVTRVL